MVQSGDDREKKVFYRIFKNKGGNMRQIFLLLLMLWLTGASAICGEFKIRRLTEFMDPENIRPGTFQMERLTPDLVRLTPGSGEKKIVLELKVPRKIDDDSIFFSIPLYPVLPEGVFNGCRVALNTPSGLGENGIRTVTFPYRRDHNTPRGWENLVSEKTLAGLHESRRKGMKIKALEFQVDRARAIYFRTPQLYSGTRNLPKLATAWGSYSNTWYGETAPILPFRFRNGAYECTLSMQDAFQKKPFYETKKYFDFRGEGDPFTKSDPLKTLQGFALPDMPEGTYWCRLLLRDPSSGNVLKETAFDYQVLASPVKTMPEFPDHQPGCWPINFEPDSADFIFESEKSISGSVRIGDFSNWVKPGESVRLVTLLQEYRHRESRMGWETFFRNVRNVGREGGTIRVDIPTTEKMAPQNRAFLLSFQLMKGGIRLASESCIVGVRGRNNEYRPPAGKIRTWEEMFQKPILGEGPHPLRWLHPEEMEILGAKIKKEGYSEYVDIDAMWSGNTEPLPGFYTYGYIDRCLNTLRKHGLYAILHTSGIGQPAWSIFHNVPSRLHDGRFLRGDIWTPAPSPYDKYRARKIHENIERLGKRYAKDPVLGFWVFWGYGGEGFTADWALSWRYGGGITGYCAPGAEIYRSYIRKKYKTMEALNRAYGTGYPAWDAVELPMPPVEKESRTSLRNPRPAYSLPYEDFKAAKEKIQQEYYEGFIARDFRKIDPYHPFAIYYYGDAETEYIRTTPEFFRKNPGLIQRNGGNEIAGVWNKQYMHFRAYENTPTMSEDVRVYADTLKDWQSNIFNGARIGRLGVHFFNYSLILAQKKNGKTEVYHTDHHHPAIARFFQGLRKEAFSVLGKTEPMPPKVAVYYNYYDNVRTGTCPANELFYSRFLAEPINDRFVDRLRKHYKVLLFDSGAPILPEKAADAIVDWVREGGTLILTPATAAWQVEKLAEKLPGDHPVHPPLQHGHYLLERLGIPLPEEGRWGSKIAGAFRGKSVSKTRFPNTPVLDFLNGESTYLFPKGSYPQAEVLAVLESPAAVAGNPCALEFKIGKGCVILLSQYPRTKGTELYGDLLTSLGVPRYLSFSGTEEGRDEYFNKMLGYRLHVSDGSEVLMVQYSNNKPDPHFTPERGGEKEPFRRYVRAHLLPKGRYQVFEISDGRRALGTFSADELDKKGIPADFHFNELKIFHLIQE